jgi:hypothetical protein
MKSGRNEPCYCGSGKKTKHCHGEREKTSNVAAILVGAVVLVGAGMIVAGLNRREAKATPAPPTPAVTQTSTPSATAPQTAANATAPGPAPQGKVWSVEHGHWHDVNATGTPQTPSPIRVDMAGGGPQVQVQTSGKPAAPSTQQPPGAAPPGMVWSPEHGHWHPTTTPANPDEVFNVRAFPAGRPPARQAVPQPPGAAPPGQVWSEEHGHWHKATTATNP